MSRFSKGAVASALILSFGLLAWSSKEARANPVPPSASCAMISGGNAKAVLKKREDQMNAWLAEGKSDFMLTTYGLCGW